MTDDRGTAPSTPADDAPLRVARPADGVLELVLDRPARRNALDGGLQAAIAKALARLDGARCVLLRGEGPAFCAGYDLHDLDASSGGALAVSADTGVVPHEPVAARALDRCPVPIVAALHGPVLGGGLEVALACDLRVAADDARLGAPAALLGLVYSHEGLARMHAVLGASLARDLLLTGEALDADRAHAAGIVHRRCTGEELRVHALDLATAVAARSPTAQYANRAILRALERGGGRLTDEQRSWAVDARRMALRSPELLEGVRRFQDRVR